LWGEKGCDKKNNQKCIRVWTAIFTIINHPCMVYFSSIEYLCALVTPASHTTPSRRQDATKLLVYNNRSDTC
jgi:hypothetical protein